MAEAVSFRKIRCLVCAKQFSYDEHMASLVVRCEFPKKTYEAFEREVDIHSRAAGPEELDDDGNPAICGLCTAKAVKKIKERG